MDTDDMEIDPAIAAAMGFTNFGAQPSNKKRKFDNANNDAVVDPSILDAHQAQQHSNGANSLPLGNRKPKSAASAANDGSGGGAIPAGPTAEGASASAMPSELSKAGPGAESGVELASGEPNFQALRKGVRNADGDMVYFLPSFLDDPWKELRAA